MVAIIPARGQSKRIAKKNIKDFLGFPIISYPIKILLDTSMFDEVMVSTEDIKIANTAKQFSANVPFLRSKKTSDDFTGIVDVIMEVLDCYSKSSYTFEYGCCILPTAVCITTEMLKKAFNIFINKNYDSLFPIVQFSYPPQRGLYVKENKIEMLDITAYEKRSQDFEPIYHDAGQFYFFKVDALTKYKKMFMKNSGAVIYKETEVQDIDNLEDWKLAELKYQLLNNMR
ncbi:MAG: pseudaminic acid cytidylyltransferase [bacterium]|nr:pseudaminic acid cytidylyltransferase [bacterium]